MIESPFAAQGEPQKVGRKESFFLSAEGEEGAAAMWAPDCSGDCGSLRGLNRTTR